MATLDDGNLDLLNESVRKRVLEEIHGDENKRRKAESLRRFEMYRNRQRRYILNKLGEEYSQKTIRNMRKITSINLVKRINDEQASIYNNEPGRVFENVNDKEKEQLKNLYEFAMTDVKLKMSNRYFKLEDQGAIQVMPKDGVIMLRNLLPHHYDVVPDVNDPEKAHAYILNILNKSDYVANLERFDVNLGDGSGRFNENINNRNEKIGDADDYKSELNRFIVWTKDWHYEMNGKGQIVGEVLPNPIGVLPFVDVAQEKDFEFFVRRGNSLVDFALEFAVLLSDTADINKLQGFAQAIVKSISEPTDLIVGQQKVLWLPINPEVPEATGDFKFANPSPDMSASLELLETYLRLFLTSQGLDPKTVSGKAEGQSFSSGIERMLSMIEKFEASSSDFDLFRSVEQKIFDLMVMWSNLMQDVTDNGLIDELRVSRINDKAKLVVNYKEPAVKQTQKELEDSAINLLDNGLISRAEAIAEIRGISLDEAKRIIEEEIDGDDMDLTPVVNAAKNTVNVSEDFVDKEVVDAEATKG